MRRMYKVVAAQVILSAVLVAFSVPAYAGDSKALADDNSAFALDLYGRLRATEGNMFLSPYSISTALSMTYAGARGNTEKQMAKVLRFSLSQKKLHPAFTALESELNKIQKAGNIELGIANSLWPQKGYKFLDEYMALIKKHYGVSSTAADYTNACEEARTTINKWVEGKTRQKIKELIKPGILTPLTRLVLVNAIYFKGNWENQFATGFTKDAPFFVSAKKSVNASLMQQTERFKYSEEGTEAAAATAVVVKGRGMPSPPPVFRADHPFLFLIQENGTGSILLMGRVADPTNAGE